MLIVRAWLRVSNIFFFIDRIVCSTNSEDTKPSVVQLGAAVPPLGHGNRFPLPWQRPLLEAAQENDFLFDASDLMALPQSHSAPGAPSTLSLCPHKDVNSLENINNSQRERGGKKGRNLKKKKIQSISFFFFHSARCRPISSLCSAKKKNEVGREKKKTINRLPLIYFSVKVCTHYILALFWRVST